MEDKKLSEYTWVINRLKEIEENNPISIEGIMKVVEEISYMSNYGIFPEQICELLEGICHNDYGWSNQPDITKEQLAHRIQMSNKVIELARFWNKVLVKDLESRN